MTTLSTVQLRHNYYVVESNSALKVKFQGLHKTVVDNVNAADVIDFLFQEEVIGHEDLRTLHAQGDHRQQSRNPRIKTPASFHPTVPSHQGGTRSPVAG